MASRSSSTRLSSLIRSASLYLGLLALFVVSWRLNDNFLTVPNLRDVLSQVSNNGIVAIGMTLVILTAGIDLSVGSLLSMGTVVCAMLLMQREWSNATYLAVPTFSLTAGILAAVAARALLRSAPRSIALIGSVIVGVAICAGGFLWARGQVAHGFGVIGVFLLILPVGLLLGAINGTIIAKANLQPFIVTLAMMVCATGMAKYIAGFGGRVHAIYVGDAGVDAVAPTSFNVLGSNLKLFGQELIPVPGLFFVATAIIAWVLLNKTRIGRYVYAVGGNEDAVRYSGITTERIKIFVYAVSGMLCGLAAILYCAMYFQGKADAGAGRELDAIAAVVIGGTSLMGGRGTIGGTVVGVLIFGYLNNILNLQGVPTEFQQLLKGVIIILAVVLQEGTLARLIADGYRRIRKSIGGSAARAGLPVVNAPAEPKK